MPAVPQPMNELETSCHLYQTPRYTAGGGVWHDDFLQAARSIGSSGSWDPATLLAIACFGFACGDRTLLGEVRRQPWLSRTADDGKLLLEPIPPHGRKAIYPPQAGEGLFERLKHEARLACAGRSEIYVLLSGGLDSRVIGAVVFDLVREGFLAKPPVAVTWGMSDSRDVFYGRQVAEFLGMEWVHVPLEAAHLLENVDAVASRMGAAISPIHLHRLLWFKNVSRDALVLSGSYGDSVGRGEFSGRSVLELEPLRPANVLGLFLPDVLRAASELVQDDLGRYRRRSGDQPSYVICEHEHQSQYMRASPGFHMNIVRDFCDVYQMFTHPSVYAFMWSIHPSLRTDQVYEELLRRVDPRLASIPWARTNRGLGRQTHGASRRLRRNHSDYDGWIAGELWEPLREIVDPDWFAATGLFDRAAVERLGEAIRARSAWLKLYGLQPTTVWTWLAAVRRLADRLRVAGIELSTAPAQVAAPEKVTAEERDPHGLLRRFFRRSRLLRNAVRKIRKRLLRRQALVKYPLE